MISGGTVVFSENGLNVRGDLEFKLVIIGNDKKALLEDTTHGYSYGVLRGGAEVVLVNSTDEKTYGFVSVVTLIDKTTVPDVVGELINATFNSKAKESSGNIYDSCNVFRIPSRPESKGYWVLMHK